MRAENSLRPAAPYKKRSKIAFELAFGDTRPVILDRHDQTPRPCRAARIVMMPSGGLNDSGHWPIRF